jgi:hypothetical protein
MPSLSSCTDRIRTVTFIAARCAHAHWQRCLRYLPPFRAINGNVAVPSGGQLKVPTSRVDLFLFRALGPVVCVSGVVLVVEAGSVAPEVLR